MIALLVAAVLPIATPPPGLPTDPPRVAMTTMRVQATSYCEHGRTATGTLTHRGTRVIPSGTKISYRGQHYIAEDTGGVTDIARDQSHQQQVGQKRGLQTSREFDVFNTIVLFVLGTLSMPKRRA